MTALPRDSIVEGNRSFLKSTSDLDMSMSVSDQPFPTSTTESERPKIRRSISVKHNSNIKLNPPISAPSKSRRRSRQSIEEDEDVDEAIMKMKPGRSKSNVSSNSFTVEELQETDTGYDSDIEVIYPDQCEEPESDWFPEELPLPTRRRRSENPTDSLIDRFAKLHCKKDGGKGRDSKPRAQPKKKRRGGDTIKRSYSQSMGSDTEVTTAEDGFHDVPKDARRLRRRIVGSGLKSSPLSSPSPWAIEVVGSPDHRSPSPRGPEVKNEQQNKRTRARDKDAVPDAMDIDMQGG